MPCSNSLATFSRTLQASLAKSRSRTSGEATETIKKASLSSLMVAHPTFEKKSRKNFFRKMLIKTNFNHQSKCGPILRRIANKFLDWGADIFYLFLLIIYYLNSQDLTKRVSINCQIKHSKNIRRCREKIKFSMYSW